VGKTLVIAEKPSVARDLSSALPGSFTSSKDKTHLVGDDYVVTWAVGHLVGLAEPDAYDPKLKKWRFADLPILPEKFKLVPNDDRAKKQLNAIHRQMKDEEIETILNACDAGREGELIFAYVYETAGVDKPVQRLWLSSMTKRAIADAFGQLRPGEEMLPLEAAARSRSEADWVVGMNATRAASIRLRAAFDGAVSLGRVQTPTLALVARREEEIRAFKPEPYWLVEAAFAASEERLYSGRPARRHHEAREEGGARARAAALRPHLAAAPREHALRLLGAAHAGLGPAPLRGSQGAHLSAHELALPDRRHDPRDQAHRGARGPQPGLCARRRVRGIARQAAARACDQRRQGRGPPRDHPHALGP
jgi:DNA topoisomerase IA